MTIMRRGLRMSGSCGRNVPRAHLYPNRRMCVVCFARRMWVSLLPRPHQPGPELDRVVGGVLIAAVDLAVGEVEVADAAGEEFVVFELIGSAQADFGGEVE